MALSAGTQIEIRTGGSDTICGGGFDPTQTAGMFTDGAATSANTAAPVFSSASYTFVAGDVDAYVFIGAGTNWTRGWYKIVSVNAGAATLSATAGGYQAYSTSTNESAGCASVASPTGATWSIDYSQQNAAEFSGTDGTAAGAGSTLSSATIGFGSQMVGNVVRITAGTNATTGHHVITSVAAGVATFNNAVTTGATADTTIYVGGGLASPGYCGAIMVGGNSAWLAAGTYSVTSTSNNVSGGRMTMPAGSTTLLTALRGYNTFHQDNPTGADRPIIRWGVNAGNAYLVTGGSTFNVFRSIIFDGNRANYTQTSAVNKQGGSNSMIECKVMGCSGSTIIGHAANDTHFDCEFTDCSVDVAIANNSGHVYVGCYFHDMATNAASITTGSATFIECIFDSNTGTGITSSNNSSVRFYNCVFYNNTSGISFTAAPFNAQVHDCIFEGNSAYGINCSANYVHLRMWQNAFYNNTSGKYVNVNNSQINGEVVPTTGVFVDAAGGDFRLNLKPGGGGMLRGNSHRENWPGLTFDDHRDIGAAQHTGRRHGDLDG